jgi:hypothetical protein
MCLVSNAHTYSYSTGQAFIYYFCTYAIGAFTGMSETFLLEVGNDNDLVALAELDLLLFVGGELKAAVTFADSCCTQKKNKKKLKAAVAFANSYCTQKLSKVHNIVTLYSECTRALTSENVCQ